MKPDQPATFQPVALLLAAALPGLGHAYLGRVRRAAMIFLGVMGMFVSGMLIGGIDAVDRVEDKWWFVLQAGVGPVAFAVDAVHQARFKVPAGHDPHGPRITPAPTLEPGAPPVRFRKSLGRVNEVGSLYCALAGMLNMIAIIDAAWAAPRRRERRTTPGSPATPATPGTPAAPTEAGSAA